LGCNWLKIQDTVSDTSEEVIIEYISDHTPKMNQQQLQPWHIFSAVFVGFWAVMSYFDNFFITLILCVGAGFATDNLNKFMKGTGDDDDEDLPKPSEAAAKVEETLLNLKDTNNDLLS